MDADDGAIEGIFLFDEGDVIAVIVGGVIAALVS